MYPFTIFLVFLIELLSGKEGSISKCYGSIRREKVGEVSRGLEVKAPVNPAKSLVPALRATLGQ